MPKEKIKNDLFITRHQCGVTRKQVSSILETLGYKSTSAIEKYERGAVLPPLRTALALEIIYRKPIAFLWPELYRELREKVRAEEQHSRAEETEEHV